MSKKVSRWPLIAPKMLPEELPEITNADEGKVLTVVEDDSGDTPVYKAEWAEPSGGVSVVLFTSSKVGVSCNKTYAELGDIFQLDKPIIGAIESEGEYSLRTPLMEAGASTYSFFFFNYNANGIRVDKYTVAQNDTCTRSTADISATWT